jgi:polysaccharide deacetylase family protein (PEP-CTERM system associated)
VIEHFFTVDVEEYFHANALDPYVSKAAWTSLPVRIDRTIPVLLDALDRAGAKGTFFVLGWIARHRPAVVRQIAAAGHEIASHGFWHRRVTTLSPESFREDIRSSKTALEDLVGAPVLGYRAPSFSIVPGGEWAFDVLLEEGYRYDSSVFPIQRRGYGYPGAPRAPYMIFRPSGVLHEFPLATTRLAGMTVPAAGGGYLRQLPFWLTRRAFADANRSGMPATFYIHPWEIDPDQPRFPVGALTRIRHYRGLSGVLPDITRLLTLFRFTSIRSHMPDVAMAVAERT